MSYLKFLNLVLLKNITRKVFEVLCILFRVSVFAFVCVPRLEILRDDEQTRQKKTESTPQLVFKIISTLSLGRLSFS